MVAGLQIGALVLAAGKASRFGSPKQLLELDGETLIDRACHTALAAGCAPVLRVLGAHAEAIIARPCPAGVETFVHPGWENGMGSSLAAGMNVLSDQSPDLDGVFVLLSDQPTVTRDLLESMAAKIRGPGISIILSDHGDATGPPSLFASRHFAELAALQGDQGAKAIAGKHVAAVAKQPFPEGRWDIDSPEVWERFTRSRDASSSNGSR